MKLQRFEERLERLVEGTLVKPLRSSLQPIEIGRRLAREMDVQRRVGVHGIIAPNSFTVTLAPTDVERFASFLDALSRELAGAARDHARTERYSFMGPIDVQIFEDVTLKAGRFYIEGSVTEGARGLAPVEVVLPDGRRVSLQSIPLVIGRMDECDIALDDRNVSRRHAEMRRVGDSVVVTDLASTNGTKVNGVAIREHLLQSGDEIEVGSSKLVVEFY